MPAYEYCCKCGGMIVISTTCSACGHKQCSECPASQGLGFVPAMTTVFCCEFRPFSHHVRGTWRLLATF
ncbi:Uncharacterized protein TPAR_03980 [Tolypocladium paradoxum]|uniref:Uncharacterized protein n=1 Tax=Tolypocladium paradoxum TaxID=94208 RepID=A0A2S4L088_9HYPO|nr:Uncharacterized protein TPAR_03980 [Tolypocladium paradoxum]